VLDALRKYTMEKPTKEQIIHRAYELWEQNGKPEGRDDELYHQAERELNEAEDPEQENSRLNCVVQTAAWSLQSQKSAAPCVGSMTKSPRAKIMLRENRAAGRV
jgi:hypothetical protein